MTPLFNPQNPPKSLCILRLSAIGDVTHALAVVQEIQRFYPECQMTWIVGKAEFALLSAVTDLNLVVYDKKAGFKGMLALWKRLSNQRFDALLNMQTALRASLLSLGIKAKYKIGFGEKRAREGQTFFVNQRVQDPENPHVMDGFMAFAAKMGVPAFRPQWSLKLPENIAQKFNLPAQYVVISPCSSKAEKDWVLERYAEVATRLNAQGHNVVLCGSPAPREMEICQKITALCPFEVINLCGKTRLDELCAVIKNANLVIAPDSGPAHIATMVGTPVIGLYAYHNPWRTGPYHNLNNVVSVYEQNALKEFGKPSTALPWATKLKGKNLMAQIDVKDVLAQVEKVLPLIK